MNEKSQKTILLVEDEFLLAITEKAQLEKYGYKVVTVNTGEKAIETFKNGHAIDLVLMDINLGSGIDGTEAAQLILQDRDVPIVFVSSHTEPEVVEKTEKITSYGYVVKSSSITVLDASIKMAFKLFDANKKVKESEHQYHALVDGMPGIVYSFSSKRGGLFYSSSTKEVLGYTPEQLFADPLLWQNSIHPDDFPHVVNAIANSKKGLPFQTKYRIKDTQGAWHWFEDRSFGARDNGGELIIDGLALDITSLKEAEEEIHARDIRLRKLFANIPDLVYQFTRRPDGSYHVPIASQGIKNIFGCSPEDVLEDFEPIGRVIHPDDAARVIADIEYSAEHLSYFTCEFRVILPGKGIQWIYSRSSPERLPDGSVTWHGFNTNITEHRNAEQNYRDLFHQMLDGFAVHEIICDANGNPIDYRFLAANPAFEHMTGLKAENIIGRTVLELLPGTEKTWIEIYGKVALTGEPAFFENYARDLGRHFAVTAFRSAPNQFSCIFIDNSDRKLREDEAVKARVLLQASIESPRDLVIMAIDRDYRYLCFNSAHSGAMKATYGKEVAVGMNILECITSQEDLLNAKANYDRALRGEAHSTLQEYGDLEKTFFESHYNPIYNEKAEIIGVTTYARDITERKQAEIALKESEVFLRAVFESVRDGFWVVDETGKIKDVSETFCQLIGYTREELLSMSVSDIEALESPAGTKTHLERIRKIGSDVFESRHRHKSGKLIDVEISVTWLGPEIRRFVSICRDFTDQKQSESRIKESEEKYRIIFDNEIYAICIFDLETLELLDVNDAYERMYGYSRERLVSGMTIHDITAEHQASDAATVQAKQKGTMYIPLRYHRKKDGSVFPVEIVGGPYEWKGRKVMFALAHDITDRKRSEDSLREALLRQQAIIDGTCAGTWEWNVQTGETVFDERWAGILGYTLEELGAVSIKTWEDLCHPDDFKRSSKLLEQHFKGELPHYEFESRMRHKDGNWIWVHDRGRVMTQTRDGKPLMMFGTHSDITVRKQAEETLKREEYLAKKMLKFTEEMLLTGTGKVSYQKILENLLFLTKAKYGLLTLFEESTGKYTTVAVAGLKDSLLTVSKLLGFEIVGKEWDEYSTENEKLKGKIVTHFPCLSDLVGSVLPQAMTKAIEKSLNMGEVAVTKVIVNDRMVGDFTLIMPSGERFVADSLVEMYSRQIDIFITRVKEEEKLQSLNKILALSQRMAKVGSWEYHISSGKFSGSDEAREIFGLPPFPEEQTIEVIEACIPDRARVHQALVDLIKRGLAYDLEYAIIPANRTEQRIISSHALLVRDENGNPVKVRGTIQDITSQKNAEASLKKSHAANMELLRELQHRAKNSFNMISSMIGLASSADASPDTRRALDYLSARVKSVSELYDLLYSRGNYTEVPLDDYFRRVAGPLVALGDSIELKLEVESVVVSASVAASLGLILTELITNAVKYAFPAKATGTVTVFCKKTSGGRAILEVSDDGVGLPVGFDLSRDAGMGLTLIQGLAEQIGGTFRIGKGVAGTRCFLEFSLDLK